jgi:hypothetical protein
MENQGIGEKNHNDPPAPHHQSQKKQRCDATKDCWRLAVAISASGRRLWPCPYEGLRDEHGPLIRCDRRSAVKFIAEVKCFADSVAERVIVWAGQDAVAGISSGVHQKRLPSGGFDV